MDETTYKLVFKGEILEGYNADDVRRNLAGLFKIDSCQIDRFFTGRPVVIKENLNHETALKYKRAINRAGADCLMEPAEQTGKELIVAEQDLKPLPTAEKRRMVHITHHIWIIVGIFFTSFVFASRGTLFEVKIHPDKFIQVMETTVTGALFVTAVYIGLAWLIKRKTKG